MHDWCYSDDRKSVFESVLAFCNKPLFIEKNRKAIPHARELRLSWSDDIHYIIRFDHYVSTVQLPQNEQYQ